jgi:hypothetical protein
LSLQGKHSQFSAEIFLAYLHEDSVKAPILAYGHTSQSQLSDDSDNDWGDENSASDSDDGNEYHSKKNPRKWLFPELELAVKDALVELGGTAFPKLNWSSAQVVA